MAVTTKNSSDQNGIQLDAQIALAQTAVNALSPLVNGFAYTIALKQLTVLQTAAVVYYMGTGRINPATVLSTLS